MEPSDPPPPELVIPDYDSPSFDNEPKEPTGAPPSDFSSMDIAIKQRIQLCGKDVSMKGLAAIFAGCAATSVPCLVPLLVTLLVTPYCLK